MNQQNEPQSHSLPNAYPMQPPMKPLHQTQPKSNGGVALMLGGLGLAAVGIIITSATYSAASSGNGGGHYVIAYGPIAVGVMWFFRGLGRMLS